MHDSISYAVRHQILDNISFRPFPLDSIKSFDFNFATITEASAQVLGPKPCCCCCCCGKKWHIAPGPTTSMVSREIDFFITNGPWDVQPGVKLSVVVNHTESIQKIKEFISLFQRTAPHIGGIGVGGGSAASDMER